ncbi:MAG: PLP-dependent aspartate aminotransferase family protein [Bacteroidetes bacterium]|nr:PLP-dependent aspartate aminotransferase family protein [Bacteroidota bacterium]
MAHPATLLALSGQGLDGTFNSIVPPIYQSSIFRFEDVGVTKGYDYTRSGNPTRDTLETLLADLEGGAGAVATTSGMAAVSTVLATLDADAHVICSHDCYGGTERLLVTLAAQGKLSVSFVDLTDASAFAEALRPNTRLAWVETPSNPLLRLVDLNALSVLTRAAGVTLAVDNTLLSPLQQRSFDLGADLVVYSTTKYLNGHSDVVGGAIIARTEALLESIRFTANAFGTIAQPFDCWLVLRGLKTLPVRLQQHEANALAVARFLAGHPAVAEVYYPGLETHPGHELALRQQRGFGGLLSFRLRAGAEAVPDVLRATEVFTLAESLGGVESLIEQPATMSHASMRPEQRAEAGITDDLIRVSIGIEHIGDLLGDLAQALAHALPEAATAREDAVLTLT